MKKIPLIKPFITPEIKERVSRVLDSGYLTEGPVTKEFENKIASYLGCKHALAVTSATTGLELALRALGIGPGDEVIVPDYTYPATASVVPIVGAKVIIIDVSKEDMLIDYQQIEANITNKTKAIIPVSLFGAPLDYESLYKLRDKYGIYIIEDAACSIGAVYKNIKIGNQADITVFSLHPRKFITTGEGGIVATNNSDLANWMDSYKHFGMAKGEASREGMQFDIIGTNFKLTNIQAAIGLGQMDYIDVLLSRRIELAKNYKKLIGSTNGIALPKIRNKQLNTQHSFQSYVVYIENRDRIMDSMRKEGIEVQIGSYALHMHNAFKNSSDSVEVVGDMHNSRWCYDHALALPLYHDLTFKDQEYIIRRLQAQIEICAE